MPSNPPTKLKHQVALEMKLSLKTAVPNHIMIWTILQHHHPQTFQRGKLMNAWVWEWVCWEDCSTSRKCSHTEEEVIAILPSKVLLQYWICNSGVWSGGALPVMYQNALLTTYPKPDIHALKRVFRLPSFPCHSTSIEEVISVPLWHWESACFT
jgi:hypothetical protein